jgi:uncharacterized protein (DUF983 family)
MPAGEALSRVALGLRRATRLRCPRCGRAPLFRGWFTMNEVCAVCDLRFERAQGYWIGAIYVNYGVTTAIAVGGYFALWAWAELSTAVQLALWLPFCVVFPLWFFRYSRAVWLAVEQGVNPEL